MAAGRMLPVEYPERWYGEQWAFDRKAAINVQAIIYIMMTSFPVNEQIAIDTLSGFKYT